MGHGGGQMGLSFSVVGRQSSRSYSRRMSEVDARDRDELEFVVDVPEGWCPPPAAARAILDVMLAVQERRATATGHDATTP